MVCRDLWWPVGKIVLAIFSWTVFSVTGVIARYITKPLCGVDISPPYNSLVLVKVENKETVVVATPHTIDIETGSVTVFIQISCTTPCAHSVEHMLPDSPVNYRKLHSSEGRTLAVSVTRREEASSHRAPLFIQELFYVCLQILWIRLFWAQYHHHYDLIGKTTY